MLAESVMALVVGSGEYSPANKTTQFAARTEYAQPSDFAETVAGDPRAIAGLLKTGTPFLMSSGKKLNALLENRDINGYIFKPTLQAYTSAKKYLLVASEIMGKSFFEPSILPDGEGGIALEWEQGGKQIVLNCQANSGQRDFLYYQQGNKYGGKNFSLLLFRKNLLWLIGNAGISKFDILGPHLKSCN